MLYSLTLGGQPSPTIFRAWVVGAPGSYLGAGFPHAFYKHIAAGPACGQHQHFGGAAHKRSIHEKGSRSVFGLITQFPRAVGARHEDYRRNVAELRSDGLLE